MEGQGEMRDPNNSLVELGCLCSSHCPTLRVTGSQNRQSGAAPLLAVRVHAIVSDLHLHGKNVAKE